MAALVAGVQYTLTSQGHLNDNKSLIFVKLTDSAIRAIEDFIRTRNKSSPSPTIQFLGNQGHLSLPTCGQSSRNQGIFKFSLSSSCDIEGPQGSFECIKHTDKGQRCLERLGQMPCKMRVQANDDVYEVTKNRMAAVEKQHKENCAREIELDKSGGPGRRLKGRSRVVDGGGGGGGGRRSGPPPAVVTSRIREPPKEPEIPSVTERMLPHTRPQTNNHTQKPANPELMKRTIRERVIHLLAVRPYKKPELFLALNKDGLKDKDKNNLMNTLMSVATCKDNTYHLMRHIWNDVNEDWPFYSDMDKKILKRRKPQNLTPPGSSDGGSSGSPRSVGSPSRSPGPGGGGMVKRPGYYDGADGLPTKRQRISHYVRPTAIGGSGANLAPPPLLPTPVTTPTHTPQSPSGGKMPHPSPPTPPHDKTPPKPPIQETYTPVSTASTKPIQEYPKYLLDYTTIKDTEQRRKYKEDFNANYNEYKKLHSLVEKVTKRFSQLDEKLRREEKGSANWQKIKDQILVEYHENKKNPRHQDAKRRFHYLHEKLSHIKRLVMEYDSKGT